MKQSNTTGFGQTPQQTSVNPLPFLSDTSVSSTETGQTLSDVGHSSLFSHSGDSESHPQASDLIELEAMGRSPRRAHIASRTHQHRDVSSESVDQQCYHFSQQPPVPCNTGGGNSHLGSNSTGGIDTLDASLYGYWHPSQWDSLKFKLNKCQKLAQSCGSDVPLKTPEGDLLMISPGGLGSGFGRCKWRFSWNGCVVGIVDVAASSDSRHSISLSIGSLPLMQLGHQQVWQQLLEVLASMGFAYERSVCSRVDLCVDIPDQSMNLIDQLIKQERFVSRSRYEKPIRNNGYLETYNRGKGDVSLRIYDKVIESLHDPVKRATMINKRWGKACEHAIRVEFQLRRKAIQKHFGIKTVEQVFDHLGTIAQWCSESWFRFTASRPDRKNNNQDRAKPHAIWQEVQQAFMSWTNEPLPRNPVKKEVLPDLSLLRKQASGCLASAMAHVIDGGAESIEQVKQELNKFTEDYAASILQAMCVKRAKLAGSGRLTVVPDEEIPF